MGESSDPRFDLVYFHRSQKIHCRAILFLILWNVLVTSCNGYVYWIYPDNENKGLTFNYIDTVYFTWISSIADPWMNLWCAPNHSSPQSSTYGKTHIASRDPMRPTWTPGPTRRHRALKCNGLYSVPQRSINEWHESSVVPVQRVLQRWRLSHADREFFRRRLGQHSDLRHNIK